MSVVTDVILTGGLEVESLLSEINRFFEEQGCRGLLLIDGRQVGGGKALQAAVLIGAFNHLDREGFLEHLRKLAWPRWSAERVRLFIQHEYDECGFHEIPIWS